MQKFLSFLLAMYCLAALAQDKDVVGANMDTAVKPGEDFFKYANGGWISRNPIPGAYSQWGIGNLVQEDVWMKLKAINEKALTETGAENSNTRKIHDFYKAAMDSAAIEALKLKPISEELARVNAIKDIPGLLKVIAYLHSIGIPVAFDLGVYQDMKRSDVYALYLTQGGLGLPNRDYYFNKDARTQAIVKDYRTKHMPSMLEFINAKFMTGATNVYDLEKSLASKSRKLEDLRDPYANYNKMSVAELQKLTPVVDWKGLFEQLNIETDSVIVGQPEFFTQLNSALKSTSLATWKNYLRFHVISSYADYLNKKVDREDFRFYGKVIRGKKEQLPRWKRVLQWEEAAMGELLGQLYVKDNFSPATKARYEKLCDNVFEAFAERIKKLDWMTEG
jgi:putative endopeptidase